MRIYIVTVEGHGDCAYAELVYYTEISALRCFMAVVAKGAKDVSLRVEYIH